MFMITDEPKFMNSPYFVMEFGNWHLLPGAHEEVMKNDDENILKYVLEASYE